MTDTVVGFDVTPLEERESTGVGRYAERLLAALVARAGHAPVSPARQPSLARGVAGGGSRPGRPAVSDPLAVDASDAAGLTRPPGLSQFL